MSAIVIERTIAATPQHIYRALTQQDELTCWWSEEARVEPRVGALGEFRFRAPAGMLQFEVAELVQDTKVVWLSRQVPPQWSGTTVIWSLEPTSNGTRLIFTHDGFAQADARMEQIRKNWEYFLGSLQSYMEQGKGTPGLPPLV